MAQIVPVICNRNMCIYTPFYCEENVYKLCEYIASVNYTIAKDSYAIFISNKSKTIPLQHQKAGGEPNGTVVWDYHVILLTKESNTYAIYDLDTKLPFPTTFSHYSTMTFNSTYNATNEYALYFRVIPAHEFLEKFSSDRRHMIEDGRWLKPPPDYPIISSSTQAHNLDDFISMDETIALGKVYTLVDFVNAFNK